MSNKYGFRGEYESKRCVGCKKKFETKNKRKRFCSDDCRVKNWVRFNKDKVKVIQKNCRDGQKNMFEVLP